MTKGSQADPNSKWNVEKTMGDIPVVLTERLTRTVDVTAVVNEGATVDANGQYQANSSVPWAKRGDSTVTGHNLCSSTDGVQEWGKKRLEDFFENHRDWRRGQQPPTPSIKARKADKIEIEVPQSARNFIECLKLRRQNKCPPCQPCEGVSMTALMMKVEADTYEEIRCFLQSQGAPTYGLPYDLSEKYISLLGANAWCERSRISLQLKLLRELLEKTEKEAEGYFVCAEYEYSNICPGSQECVNYLIKQYKKMQHCLKPIRDRRMAIHKRGKALCKGIFSATEVLYEPLDFAIRGLVNKRGGNSPMDKMISDLVTDMTRSMALAFGAAHMEKCHNFAMEIGKMSMNYLRQAAWASVALCEFFTIRGSQFPEYPPRKPIDEAHKKPTEKETFYIEGPLPPKKPVPYDTWAWQRDSYLLFTEAQHFRKLIRDHGVSKKEAESSVPAFPEKDRKLIWEGPVTVQYLNDQLGTWRSRWVVKNTITQSRLAYVKCPTAASCAS